MTSPALAGVREMLSVAGYGDDVIDPDFQVWLGPDRGVAVAEFVAFGRPAPKDMSTAVISVTEGRVDAAFEIAKVIAAPYFFLADDHHLDLWVAEPAKPVKWREAVTRADIEELRPWLRPEAAFTAKVGLRQLPLFDIPVNLLAAARSQSADRLAPMVEEALEMATQSLPPAPSADATQAKRLKHKGAARLVVGALTVLVMRDRDPHRASARSLDTQALIDRVVDAEPTTFAWYSAAKPVERSVLMALVDELGKGIDYQGLDPTILSQVYEQALVDDDDRKQLGIHYTPPRLADRLLKDLPVEIIAPDDRHVLDPSCGSGTLLAAAHDRLRDLQPLGLAAAQRHRDLAVHLHGYEIDPFASWIARLTLLLHAQPAGNGWHIEETDTLTQPPPKTSPQLIVTNPPWRFDSGADGGQLADKFVEWSIEALAPGGLLGVLLPASWLSAGRSKETRERLTSDFDIFEIWRLPEGTFSTSQATSAVVLARKRDGLGGRGSRVVREVGSTALPGFLGGKAPAGSYWVVAEAAPLSAGVPPPAIHRTTQRLEDVATVLSGPQPVKSIHDRGSGTPYLDRFRSVSPYAVVPQDALWQVAFPDDFQTARGASIVGKRKVLASAARAPNSPWRFRVAIDTTGVAMRNSMRGIAPHDQSDDALLYALAIIVGSAFASAFAATFGGDRNTPAAILKALPIPTAPPALDELGILGQQASELAGDTRALNEHLVRAEAAVWKAYGVPAGDVTLATARFAGQLAPEGAPRYPALSVETRPRHSAFRRVGAVLDVTDNDVSIWVNGVTPDEGLVIPFPPGMAGWLARSGATFDVIGVETVDDLQAGEFRFQREAWQDLALDSADPVPVVAG